MVRPFGTSADVVVRVWGIVKVDLSCIIFDARTVQRRESLRVSGVICRGDVAEFDAGIEAVIAAR